MERLGTNEQIDQQAAELNDQLQADLTIVRRLGGVPLHYRCDDHLSQNSLVFEMMDGPDKGNFSFLGKKAPEGLTEAFRERFKNDPGGGGIAPYEEVVTGHDLSRLGQVFQVTTEELQQLHRTRYRGKAPRPPVQLKSLE